MSVEVETPLMGASQSQPAQQQEEQQRRHEERIQLRSGGNRGHTYGAREDDEEPPSAALLSSEEGQGEIRQGTPVEGSQSSSSNNSEEISSDSDDVSSEGLPDTREEGERSPRRGARRTRALLRLLNVSDPAILFYLALAVNAPQVSVVLIIFPIYWHSDSRLCDAALRRYWRIWGLVHAARLCATTVVAGLRWRFAPPPRRPDQPNPPDDPARQRANALIANARNSLDALALIWFVFGNMWLLGGSDDNCNPNSSSSNDDNQKHRHDDPTQSPIYLVDVVMLAIQYAQICLPCVFAIAMVPVFCFCLPCVIRLLAALQLPEHSRGASRRTIARLPIAAYTPGMELGYEEPSCPVCLRDIQIGDRLRILPCKHAFHRRCIDEWLNRNASCPLCRRSVFNATNTGQDRTDEEDSSLTRGGRRGGAIELEQTPLAVV